MICNTCGIEKDISDFTMNGKRRRKQCKACHDTKRNVRNAANVLEKKLYMAELKSKSMCTMCGETRHYLFDFHHTDSSKKEFAISKILIGGSSLKRLLRELEKCVILCSNCHRELHYFENKK